MRTRVGFILVLVAGMALAAHVLVGDRTLSPSQLDQVRKVCPECHGDVPKYDRISQVHTKHAVFDCSFCHHDQSGLKTTDNIHTNLERVGIGTTLLVLIGMITNMFIIRGRDRVN